MLATDFRTGSVGLTSKEIGVGSEMRNGLTLRATLVMVVLAFGAASVIPSALGGQVSAGKPVVEDGTGFVAATPGPEVAMSIAAAKRVPALRASRKKTPAARPTATAAPTVVPAPVTTPTATPTTTPTAAPTAPPRYIPPPPTQTPAAPKPTPAPTSVPEDSGEFDTTGEPEPTGEP